MSLTITMVRGVVSELLRRGIDPGPVLNAVGIDETTISDVRSTVEYEAYRTVVSEALLATRDPALGLTMGAHGPATMLQVMANLMTTSGTLRQAIELLQRYSLLFASGVAWELHERGPLAYFSFLPVRRGDDCSRFTAEWVLSTGDRVGRQLLGHSDSLVEVWFQHEAPSYADRYHDVFQVPVKFGQPSNTLVFYARYLDERQPHADDTMRVMLTNVAEKMLRDRARVTTAERIRVVLGARRDLSSVDSSTVAAALGLSPRALRRRLSAEGVSVSMLLDEARRRIACEELKRSERSIRQISDQLGFSEPSAFHRAFKRWTGLTPAQWAEAG